MKKILFIGLFTLLSILSAQAYDFEVDGIYYDITNSDTKEVEVSSSSPGNRYSGSVVIPATVTNDGITYRVTSIGSSAFRDCSGLTSVTIPESVTSIGSSAFGHCRGLTSLTIPASIDTIGSWAFYGCSGLTSVTIPEGVTFIGVDAFRDCYDLTSMEWNARHCQVSGSLFKGSDLTSITFGRGVEHIPAMLCANCVYLTSVTIPGSVTSIGYRAFEYCHYLTSVTIGEGVRSIGQCAFMFCSGLTSVVIPNSVTAIEYNAFGICKNLTSVYYIGDIAQWCGMEFGDFWISRDYNYTETEWDLYINNEKVVDLVIPNSVTTIGDNAFSRCSGLTSVTIPGSVTSIGYRAFDYCHYLTSVTIGDGVTSIGDNAFSRCSGLTSVVIPNSVTSIGSSAFRDCSGLTSVTIGESVTTIGDNAFDGCSGLTSVTCKAAIPPSIGLYNDADGDGEDEFHETAAPVFSNYDVTLYVPRGCTAAYASAPEWCKFANIEEITTARVTLLVNDETMGTVTGGGEYALDEQATLVAVPNRGYEFERWDDCIPDNPRILTVTEDITLTAVFSKIGSDPTAPTSNESALSAAPFAYVQGRTAYLSDGLGEVEALTATGQRVYRGFDRSVALPRPGVYILRVVADGRRCKVVVK